MKSELIEILVVDDGSRDHTAQVVQSFAVFRGNVVYLAQAPAGLSAARNLGALHARGDVVAYLDDDTIASPGWAAAVLEAFEDGIEAVAGRVLLRYEAPRPRWLADGMEGFLAKLDLGDDTVTLDASVTPVGANFAVRRSVLEQIGGFNVALGRVGGTLLSGEENEFFGRFFAAGCSVEYRPIAVVEHRIPALRLRRRFFLRRAWWQGVTDVVMGGSRGARHEARLVARTPAVLAANLVRGRGTLSAQLWVCYAAGRLAGLRRGRISEATTSSIPSLPQANTIPSMADVEPVA